MYVNNFRSKGVNDQKYNNRMHSMLLAKTKGKKRVKSYYSLQILE